MRHNCEYLTYIHLSANWWDNPGTVNWKEGGRKWSQLDVWYCLWMDEGLRTSVRADGLWTEVRTAGPRSENFKTGGSRTQNCMKWWTEDIRTAGIWTKDLIQDRQSNDWGPLSGQLFQGLRTLGQLINKLRKLATAAGLWTEVRTAGIWTNNLPNTEGDTE